MCSSSCILMNRVKPTISSELGLANVVDEDCCWSCLCCTALSKCTTSTVSWLLPAGSVQGAQLQALTVVL